MGVSPSMGTWIPFQHRYWEKEYPFSNIPLGMLEKWSSLAGKWLKLISSVEDALLA
jgi:hypothetical protein